MKVILQNDFFTPLGYRIRRGDTKNMPVDVPDVFFKNLPKSAVVVEGGPVEDIPDMSGKNPVMAELYGGDNKRQAAQAEEQKLRDVAEQEEADKAKEADKVEDEVEDEPVVEEDAVVVEDEVKAEPVVEEPKAEKTEKVKASRRRSSPQP